MTDILAAIGGFLLLVLLNPLVWVAIAIFLLFKVKIK